MIILINDRDSRNPRVKRLLDLEARRLKGDTAYYGDLMRPVLNRTAGTVDSSNGLLTGGPSGFS